MSNNFKTALNQVLGKTPEETKTSTKKVENLSTSKTPSKPDAVKEAIKFEKNLDILNFEPKKSESQNKSEPTKPLTTTTFASDPIKTIETTTITKGTKIDGSVSSESNVHIHGTITGNVSCTASVVIAGKVIGNIDCENFDGDRADIEGNINSKNRLSIRNNTSVVGDVSASKIEVSGKIKGNIISADDVTIMSDGLVVGDITSKSISIEKGAGIQGAINIQTDSK